MIRRHTIMVLLVASVIAAAIWINAFNKQTKNNISFRVLIFEGVNGWGYDILVNDSLFIHQESVPATGGKKGFSKKEQATRTAQLIINKMKNDQLPVITTFELEEILSLKDMRHE